MPRESPVHQSRQAASHSSARRNRNASASRLPSPRACPGFEFRLLILPSVLPTLAAAATATGRGGPYVPCRRVFDMVIGLGGSVGHPTREVDHWTRPYVAPSTTIRCSDSAERRNQRCVPASRSAYGLSSGVLTFVEDPGRERCEAMPARAAPVVLAQCSLAEARQRVMCTPPPRPKAGEFECCCAGWAGHGPYA